MTIVSNIPFFGAAGLPGIAQGTADTAAPQGLLDFLGLLLGAPEDAGAMPDLQAKLAALLQNPPAGQETDVRSLLKLLQPGATEQAAPAQDIIKKLAQMLEAQGAVQGAVQAPAPSIRPALTSDLTAASAPVIQDAPETGVAAAAPEVPPMDNRLAAPLDEIEAEAEAEAEVVAATAGEEPALDRDILRHLVRAATAEGRDGKAFDQEKIVEFLKEQGVDAGTLDKYIAVIEKVAAAVQQAAPAEQAAKTPDIEILRAVQAEIANNVAPKTEKPAETKHAFSVPAAKTEDEKTTGMEAKAPATVAAPKAQHEAPEPVRQKTAPVQDKTAEAPAHPSLINSMVSAEAPAQGQAPDAIAAAAKPVQAVNHMAAPRAMEAPVTQMVTVQLQANASNKVDMMTLQLEPASLGRLDIKLKFGKDGEIRAHLSVDRPETLAMLQKDAAHLQRALHQAGFDADDASLSFDLRQQGQQQPDAGHAQDHGQRGGYGSYANSEKQNDAALMAQIAIQAQGYISQGGVNIMV